MQMIRNIIIRFIPAVMVVELLTSSSHILAQRSGYDSLLLKSKLYREKLHIFTDRNFYAAGEKIFFRVINLTDTKLKEMNWSTVLYIELIDAGNKPYFQGKFKLENWGASGYIYVPPNLRTGNYYIRAYTKWMRNFSPYDYAYSLITLINPYSEETNDVLNAGANEDPIINLNTGGIKVLNNIIKCSASQETNKKREKVELDIKIPDKEWISPAGYCVSVIKSGAINSNIYGLNLSSFKGNDDPAEIKYWPEMQGLSLSGSINKKNLNAPSAYAEVHLSVVGDDPNYIGYLTEQQGKFLFSLPDGHDTQNFFIGVETKDQDPVEILIDNDFSTDLINLPLIPFILSGEEKNITREIMFNMQLEKAYNHLPDSHIASTIDRDIILDSITVPTDTTVTPEIINLPEPVFFYGKPEITLKPDDYVKLPNLEEFFIELIPQASVVKRKEGIAIVMKGNNPDIAFYKPLILLDFVPVFKAENLLRLSPELIDRIEVINSTYVRGNMCFGGIISVFSKKGDMAGIDLPENSYFFDFKTYEPQDKISFPDYSRSPINKRIPDFRNTMYWNPDIHGKPGETVSCEFFTSDNTGEYIILVRGITEQGSVLEGHCSFTVK
jgi:hypothetical protein